MASEVPLSNPDKVLWPADGVTKRDLLEYYRAAAPALIPHLKNRPLTVKRYPDGIDGEAFFQKNAPRGTPEWVRTVTLPAESAKREVAYVLCNDFRTLAWLSNLASLELHPWLSRVDRLERPDWLVMDIDPLEGGFELSVRAALAAREVLRDHGLDGCAKTSGGKGVHVYIPLQRRYDFGRVLDAGLRLSTLVEEREPSLVTTQFKKADREGKVFMDYTRNRPGQHVAAAFSPRARPGAPVSWPVAWSRIEQVHPLDFTIATAPKFLERGDPWPKLCPAAQTLPPELSTS
jgi:bifunctional non-homologous end joining protein LigD